ncbi:hypothetical protein KAR91_77270 [Candidatus Pacearchaeota archaeon]|nr:hypothetical protein [Candidatus Pacearchaeota archaeon]
MKNLWFNFWAEFDRVFNNPREIHRVIVIMLFAISLSHVIYIYYSIPDIKWDTSAKLAVILGGCFSMFIMAWCFRSNEMTIDLFNRFAIVAGLSGLFHRIIFYAIVLGDPYFVTISIICFIVFGIWAITGKNYQEFKDLYVRPALKNISKIFIRHEKKDNTLSIHSGKSAVNE